MFYMTLTVSRCVHIDCVTLCSRQQFGFLPFLAVALFPGFLSLSLVYRVPWIVYLVGVVVNNVSIFHL